MSKQTVKETMQQSLDMLEKGGLNCEQEEFIAQSLRKAIADYEQAEKPVAWIWDAPTGQATCVYKKLSIATAHSIGAQQCYTHPSNVRRLTAKEERALINPIMHEYGISAAPFLELIDKVQDAMMKSNGGSHERTEVNFYNKRKTGNDY